MGKRGKQNRHALRHGIETTNLPRELAYYDRAKEIFRRRLEDAVLEVKGCMTLRENTRIIAAALRYRNFKMRGAKLADCLTRIWWIPSSGGISSTSRSPIAKRLPIT